METRYSKDVDFEIKHLAFYRFQRNTSSESINSLVILDNRQMIHILSLKLNDQADLVMQRKSFSLASFFGCDQLLVEHLNKDDIKGLVYDEESNRFYAFINRHYLSFQNNYFLESSFTIWDTDLESGRKLKFEEDDHYLAENVQFEYSTRKWTNSLGPNNYLVLFDMVFDIRSNGMQSMWLKTHLTNKLDTFRACNHQTLQIDDLIYCFEQQTYRLIGDPMQIKNDSPRFRIDEMFNIRSNRRGWYDSGQLLEFIFNYKKDSFIMLTQTNYFIISYHSVHVDYKTKQLIIEPFSSSSFFIYKGDSCLYRKCRSYVYHYEAVIEFSAFGVLLFIAILILIYLTFYACSFCNNKRQIQSFDLKRPETVSDVESESSTLYPKQRKKVEEYNEKLRQKAIAANN